MILVTGGTGLVGSHLLVKLTQAGENIRAIYRSEKSLEKCKKVFEAYQAQARFNLIEWKKADLTDYFSLADQMEGIRQVYHAAAVVSFSAQDASKMMQVNIEGTTHVANLCLLNQVEKLCYVSSVAALGSYPNEKCTDEEAIWQKEKFTSDYSVSKYYAENEIWRASQEGLKVVIVNPATIIGFGNWDESSSAIIKRVAQGLSYYPTGSNGFVGVEDVVDCMLQLMQSEVVNERFILVSENLKFKTLFDYIADAFNKKRPRLKVNVNLAKIALVVDRIKAFLTGQKAILTPQTLRTSFRKKCFTANKVRTVLSYEFTPIEQVVEEACKFYKESA